MEVTKEQVESAKLQTLWSFGDEQLYRLCRENFRHIDPKIIIAKVLFIGRIYAAAVERRDPKADKNEIGEIAPLKNDEFYTKRVVRMFKESELDKTLNALRGKRMNDQNVTEEVLKLHGYLVAKLNEITCLNKRSFVSKYLHFHLPELFFIYDSRALNSIHKYVKSSAYDKANLTGNEIDFEYAKFYHRCIKLKNEIKGKYGEELTPRQIDNLLLHHS